MLEVALLVAHRQERRRALASRLHRREDVEVVALGDVAKLHDVLGGEQRVVVGRDDPLQLLAAQRLAHHAVDALRPEHARVPREVDAERLRGDRRAVHVVGEPQARAGLHEVHVVVRRQLRGHLRVRLAPLEVEADRVSRAVVRVALPVADGFEAALLHQPLQLLRLVDRVVRVVVVGVPAHQHPLKVHLAAATLHVVLHDLVEVGHRDPQPAAGLEHVHPVAEHLRRLAEGDVLEHMARADLVRRVGCEGQRADVMSERRVDGRVAGDAGASCTEVELEHARKIAHQ